MFLLFYLITAYRETSRNKYNHEHMLGVASPAILAEASHEGNGADKVSSSLAGSLVKTLPLSVGCRVMLTRNLWGNAGLVNGAQGTVYDISWREGADVLRDPPEVVMVAFDEDAGPSFTMPDGEPLRSGEHCPTDRFLALRSPLTNIASRELSSGRDRKIARSGERKEAPRSVAEGRATDERSDASNFILNKLGLDCTMYLFEMVISGLHSWRPGHAGPETFSPQHTRASTPQAATGRRSRMY
jgi:hypothetical protein